MAEKKIKVKGYLRTTPKGTRVVVRPYLRKKSKYSKKKKKR